jgi:hypothetical protein
VIVAAGRGLPVKQLATTVDWKKNRRANRERTDRLEDPIIAMAPLQERLTDHEGFAAAAANRVSNRFFRMHATPADHPRKQSYGLTEGWSIGYMLQFKFG